MVQAASAQSLNASLSPTTISSGGVTSLTLSINNSGGPIVNQPTISYSLPGNVTLVGTPTTDCFGGTISSSSAAQFAFASDALPGNSTCTISATLTSSTPGTVVFPDVELFTEGALTSTDNVSSLSVDGARAIVTQQFTPASVTAGAAVTLTYTFDFSNVSDTQVAGLSVTDTLPANVEIDTPVTVAQTCSGVDVLVSADTGANEITVSSTQVNFGPVPSPDPRIATPFTCDITVPLRATTSGTAINTVETASYQNVLDFGSSVFPQVQTLDAGAAEFTVVAAPAGAPRLAKAFSPNPVDGTGAVTATFTITYTVRDTALTDIAFTDTLRDTGLEDLTFDQITGDSCGFTASQSTASDVTFSAGSIPASTNTCTLEARYTYSAGTVAPGRFDYPTNALTGTISGNPVTGNSTSASLVIPTTTAPTFGLQIVDAASGGSVVTNAAPGDTVFAEFTLTNTSTQTLRNGSFTFDGSMVPGTVSPSPSTGFCGASSQAALDVSFAEITYSALELAGSASCSFVVQLNIDTSASGSTVSLQSSDLLALVSGTGFTVSGASASFTVSGALGLTATQTVPSVTVGAATTLTTTLTAGAENATDLTDITFSQDVASIGLLGFVSAQSNTCGGMVSDAAGTYTFAGGTLAAGESCEVVVNVTVPNSATPGASESISTSGITANGGGQTFAAAVGNVTVLSGLDFALEILNGPALPGGTVRARYTIDNTGSADATNLQFTHSINSGFPGLTYNATPVSNTCGGTPSVSGTTFLIFASGTLPGGSSCQIEFDLNVPTSLPTGDTVPTTTSALSATLGGASVTSPAATGSIEIETVGFEVAKSFGQSSVTAGNTVPMTITFTPSISETLSNVSLTDDLDAFVSGATLDSEVSDSCGAAALTSGASLISLSGIVLTGGAACSVTVNVAIPSGAAAGTFENTTSTAAATLFSTTVTAPAASASLSVISPTASATLAKSFTPSTANAGGTTTVSYTIDNPAGGASLTRLGLSDPIGTDIPGATLSGLSGSCGTGSSISGTTTLDLTGGILAPGESCTFSATVNVPSVTPATFTSTTSALTDVGLTVAAGQAASLTVVSPPPIVTVATSASSIIAGTDVQVVYTIDNSASAVGITNLSFAQAFGAFLPGPGGTASNTCGGTFLPTPTGATLVGGSIAAGGSCALTADLTSLTLGTQSLPAPTVGATEFPSIANTAAFSVEVVTPPPPPLALAFAPATIEQGTTSTATLTITNATGAIPATSLDLSNTLPAGLVVATPANASTTCTGGTLTATSGAGGVSYTGGTVNALTNCTITYDVLGASAGSFTNTTGALTSSFGSSGTAAATLTVDAPSTVTAALAFAPTSVAQGATSTYTLTLTSAAAALDTVNIAASQTLPAGLVVADVPNASTTCTSATLGATAGGSSITLTGGTLTAGANCAVTVDVVSVLTASYPTTLSSLGSDFGVQAVLPSATLTVVQAPAATVTSAFAPTSVAQGGVATLTVTLDNAAAAVPTTLGALQDALPTGLNIASPDNAATTCVGSTVSASGTSGFATGGAGVIPAGGSCTVSIDVTSDQATTFSNPIDQVPLTTGLLTGVGSADITFTPAPAPTAAMAFAPDNIPQGSTSALTVTFDNSAALVAAGTVSSGFALPPGVSLVAPVADTGTCGADVTQGPGGVGLSLTSLAASTTCTTTVTVTAVTAGTASFTLNSVASTLGAGAATGADLNVTAADAPTFTKVFAPDSVELGGETRMTLTIDNSGALVPATAGSITDTFPAGLELAATPNVVSSCTSGASTVGTVSAAAGSFGVAGITVAAQESCTYAVSVRATQGPSLTNTTDALSTSLGNSGTASATLTVSDAPRPTLSAAFTPATTVQGGTSRLSVSFTNSSTLIDATGAAFSAPLPAGMVVAAVPNASLTCASGTVTAVAGASTVSFLGATIPLGGTCAFAVDVLTTSLETSQTVTTGAVETDIGNSAAGAEATLTLTPAPLPTIAKVFAPNSVTQGEVSTLTYTISNSALLAADIVTLGETFAGGPVLADPLNFGGTCGATPTGTAGDATLSFSGGTIAAGASCDLTVDVASATVGTFDTVSGDLVTTLGNSGTASATLTVTEAPLPVLTVDFDQTTVAQGGAATLTYTLVNSASIAAEQISFANTLPDGMSADAAGTPANSCGGTFSSTAQGPDVSLTGGIVAAGDTCTITLPVIATTVGTNAYAVAFATSLGDTVEASDSLNVTAAPVPVISATLTPDTVVEGGVTTFEVTFDNSASLIDADDLNLSLETGALLTVAPTPNATSTCVNPTIALTPGDDDVSLTADAIPAGSTCTFSFDIRALQDGPAAQATGLISTALGDSVGVSVPLTITPAGAPLFSGALAPATVTQGNASTLTYTIDNTANLIAATGATFSVTLGGTMQVATPPTAASTCAAGAVTAAAGDSTFSFSGGTVAEGTSCTVSVNVTSLDTGTFSATAGDLTTSLGTSSAAAVSLNVGTAPAPEFRQTFTPPSIGQGQTSRLELVVDNSSSGLPAAQVGRTGQTGRSMMAGSLGFDANLPAGLTLASVPNASNSCGGTVSADPNGGQVTLTGGAVAGGSTCTVGVDVTSIIEGVVPTITGSLSSSLGGATLAAPSTPLVVTNNPFGSVTFVQNSVADGTFAFSSTQAAFNFSIATAGGSGSFGPVSVSTGTYTVTQTRPAGIGNETLVCSDMNSTVDVTAGTVTLAVDLGDDITCTWGAVNSRQETVDQINTFLNRRNNLILSTGPSSARRMARLNQGVGRSETLRFQQGDLASATPFSFDLLSLGSNNYKFSTSLQQIERSRRMFRLAVDGVEDNEQVWTPPRWDVWFEASYTRYEASGGSDGHFGIAYLGADYLVSEDILAGFLLQYDSLDDGDDGGATIDGTGWMAGPYVTARIAPNLIFDGRIAYGQSSNSISPFGTYTDEFETDRFLVDATLSGNFDWDNWVVTPNLSLSYIEDRAESYVDSLGVTIPEQKVSLGQIRLGPTFSTVFEGRNQTVIRPTFTVNGIYNFSDTDGVTIVNDTSGETDGFRGRVEASVQISGRSGIDLTFGMHYDGIGASDFEAYGARLQLSIPLN
ncbi:autotransporter outer membrane beta-barrel domain-containing protein [uncultured Tateyamaria sp.]|uniref:autotransporter outer membrane beta-barrel domain-containing protein n=1 Tax=Tateyamaria sp. 1078 TaxID=3417464 RepID=UPI0026172F5E|nr:autotransporter outer membrane beta-barrel domain-containing protein [uncultured Tateyamaria sp.]